MKKNFLKTKNNIKNLLKWDRVDSCKTQDLLQSER